MRLILVRHGQTDYNVAGIIQGRRVNSVLNATGTEQAEKVGKRLADYRFDVVYASDQTRAVQTAEAIIAHHPYAQIIKDPALREKDGGIFDGKKGYWFHAFRKIMRKTWEACKPWGGESMLELQKRSVDHIEMLAQKHQGQTVLVVSHGAVINAATLHLQGIPFTHEAYRANSPKNTSVFEFEWNDGDIIAHRVNCVAHLQP